MKNTTPILAAYIALAALLVANSLQAQTNFIWDPNGPTNGVGGTGTWTTNATIFTTNPAGSSATVSGNFVSAANPRNNAVFEGTAGTVSLGGSTFSGTIFVNTTGYTFQNSSTSGTSANRYFNTTNGILLAEGVNLNLSSGNGGGLASTGAITGLRSGISAAPGAENTSVTITGSTTNADHFIRIGWGTNGLGANANISVPVNISTTGPGQAAIVLADTVTNTISGNVTVNSGSRLVLGTGTSSSAFRRLDVTGDITAEAGALAIGEAGSGGRVVLSGSNSLSGDVVVQGGRLGFGSTNALGTATVVLNQGTGFGQVGTIGDGSPGERTIGNNIRLAGSTATLGAGLNTTYFSGNIDLGGETRTVTISNWSTHVSGAITNGGINLISLPDNTDPSAALVIRGTSTYAGPTTVTSGRLLIDTTGEISLSDVSVLSGAVIGGDGILGGSLSLAAGAKFVFGLTDTLTVNGASVSFGGFGIGDLEGLTSAVAEGEYTIIDGLADISLTNLNNIGLENAFDLGDGKKAYFSTGSLVVNVVPEPSTTALLVLSGLGLAGYTIRRRRR
jgi:autotransporter-associated beta strand protein